jgi:hypothetical protein
VLKQVGYSLADILAKAAYGLAIYKVARVKSRLADPAYDDHSVDPAARSVAVAGAAVTNERVARTSRPS